MPLLRLYGVMHSFGKIRSDHFERRNRKVIRQIR